MRWNLLFPLNHYSKVICLEQTYNNTQNKNNNKQNKTPKKQKQKQKMKKNSTIEWLRDSGDKEFPTAYQILSWSTGMFVR